MGLDLYFSKKKYSNIGYFRKVNFLVKFFEDRGFDVEHQIPMQIDDEMAEELLTYCNAVLEDHSKAEVLLPTMAGFFFGDTDYDDYYFENVEQVRDFVKNTLLPQFDNLKDDEYIEFSTWY